LPRLDDPTLIVCPKCAKRASVVPVNEETVRANCFACGFSTEAPILPRGYAWGAETPTDGFFGCELWLRTNCEGHSLWAFNQRHLTFLEDFVAARLRERRRDPYWRNASLGSRLPQWIKSSDNRESLLKAIEKLKKMAE